MNYNSTSQGMSLGIVGFGAFGQLAALHLSRYFEITAYDPSPEVAQVNKATWSAYVRIALSIAV